MLSEKQLAANRANALKSTGPRTPEGKARSAQNAIKHGLSAERVVLATEDQEAYQSLLDNLKAEHNPKTQTQEQLVADLAWSFWKLERAVQKQTQTLNADPDDIDNVMKWERYENNARRAIHKNLLALEKEAKKPAPMSAKGEKIKAILDEFCPQLGLDKTNPLFADSENGEWIRADLLRDLKKMHEEQIEAPEITKTAD
jgi:hypothetical protein